MKFKIPHTLVLLFGLMAVSLILKLLVLGAIVLVIAVQTGYR